MPVRIFRIIWILNHNDHVDMVRHNNVMVDRYVRALIGKEPDGTLDLGPNGGKRQGRAVRTVVTVGNDAISVHIGTIHNRTGAICNRTGAEACPYMVPQ